MSTQERNYTKTELATMYMGRLMSWPHDKVEALFARTQQSIENKLASILKEVGDDIISEHSQDYDEEEMARHFVMLMRKGVMTEFNRWYGRNGKLCNNESYDGHSERYYHSLLGHRTSMSDAVYDNLVKVNSHKTLKTKKPDKGRGKARFDIFRMLAKSK